MGFLGPEKPGLVEQLGVDLDERGNVTRDLGYQTSVPGVFVAGDAGRGQSLIVWAIAEGRAAAAAVDTFLTGSTTLPVADPADRAPAGRLTCRVGASSQHGLAPTRRFHGECTGS